MDDVIIRPALRGDLGAVARLAGELSRMHHAFDERRFFLPDRVEATLAALAAKGAPHVVLHTAAANPGAAAFFRRTMIEMTREAVEEQSTP